MRTSTTRVLLALVTLVSIGLTSAPRAEARCVTVGADGQTTRYCNVP